MVTEHDVEGTAVEEPGTEVVHVPQAPVTLFRTEDPVEVIEKATAVADALKGVLEKQKLFKRIQGRDHVLVEGWTTLGTMMGVTAVCVWSRRVEPPGENGYDWEARVEVRTLDGRVIGAAEALCSRQESSWRKRDDYALRSMAQCVPWRAEILTRDGFRRFDQVEKGAEVLAYDLELDQTTWTPLLEVSVFAEESVVRMRSRSFDFTCTPDHSWAVRGSKRPRLVKACDIPRTAQLVAAAPCHEGGALDSLSERDARIVGWLLTDGTLRYPKRGGPRAHIDQSKEPYVRELRDLLGEDATEAVKAPGAREFPSGVTYETRAAHRFNLTAEFVRGLIERTGYRSPADGPRLATQIGPCAREAMLDAMLKADGSRKRQSEAWRFGKRNAHVMETFQVLATLCGRALGQMTGFTMTTGAWMPTQMMRANRFINRKALNVEPAGREPVWCPTTKYGSWVMRLDGNVAITGNTRATSKALRGPLGFIVTLAGYAATPAEEMPHDSQESRPAPVVSDDTGVVAATLDLENEALCTELGLRPEKALELLNAAGTLAEKQHLKGRLLDLKASRA